MNLFGKDWKEIFRLRTPETGSEETQSKPLRENVSIGDMVMFCSNPPEDHSHCNIWRWSTGILVSVDKSFNEALILSEGKIHKVQKEWVGPLDMLSGEKYD